MNTKFNITSILNNATNLTDKMAHDILEAGLDSIFFSIDGLKEQYEKEASI